MQDEDLLELAAGLARRAAAAILAVRAAGFAVESKRDATPVTQADRIAEALIAEGLRSGAPGIPVIAEEEVEAGLAEALRNGRFWLVDPLDGTREFAAGSGEFTVNIGLVEDGAARLGAVAVPATGELFLGIAGRGAWKEEGPPDAGGAPPPRRPIAVRAPPAEGLTVYTGRHHPGGADLDAFLARQALPVARLLRSGSAVKLLRIAEGAADVFPRFGTTMEWDTAGPQAVLEGAGGRLLAWDGTPLRYRKPGYRNPGFLALGLADIPAVAPPA